MGKETETGKGHRGNEGRRIRGRMELEGKQKERHDACLSRMDMARLEGGTTDKIGSEERWKEVSSAVQIVISARVENGGKIVRYFEDAICVYPLRYTHACQCNNSVCK